MEVIQLHPRPYYCTYITRGGFIILSYINSLRMSTMTIDIHETTIVSESRLPIRLDRQQTTPSSQTALSFQPLMNIGREMDCKQNNRSRKVRLCRSSAILFTGPQCWSVLQIPRVESKSDQKAAGPIAVCAKTLACSVVYPLTLHPGDE